LELDLNKILLHKLEDGTIEYERWKDIPCYEGYFQVSSFGRVKSLSRPSERKRGNFIVSEKLFRLQCHQIYYNVTLLKDKRRKGFPVHQLMAMAFLNHKPNKFTVVVDHKDNDPLNNHIDNLQLVSNRKNSSKDRKRGTSKYIGVHWSRKVERWK